MISGPGVVSPSARPSIICTGVSHGNAARRPARRKATRRRRHECKQRRFGEEPAHCAQRVLPSEQERDRAHRDGPEGKPDRDHAPIPPAKMRMRGVGCGRRSRRAVVPSGFGMRAAGGEFLWRNVPPIKPMTRRPVRSREMLLKSCREERCGADCPQCFVPQRACPMRQAA